MRVLLITPNRAFNNPLESELFDDNNLKALLSSTREGDDEGG